MKRTRASKANAAMGPSIFSIPDGVLMEILSNLPMTTICNCRCVCSYFRNLISNPEFAQLHLSRSQPSLMLCSCYSSQSSTYVVESFRPCAVDSCESCDNGPISISNKSPDTPAAVNRLLKFEPKCEVPAEGLKVLSSCNGLICFYGPRTYNPYVICNPVIDEYVIVPQNEKYNFDQCGSGFGLCPRTEQYKVLRFLSPRIGFGCPGLIRLEAEINTLGTNLWRRVGDAPRYLHLYSDGCFFNGALHWIVHDTENCFESMHHFDFGKERFQPFPGPSQFYRFLGQLRVDAMKMGVLKDRLSISYSNCSEDMLDIWVMKDYAVQDSWTKDFVIEMPWVVEPKFGQIYQPLMVSVHGDILMQFGLSELVSCNMRDRSFCTRKVLIGEIKYVSRAMTYIPSFVSIRNAAIQRHSLGTQESKVGETFVKIKPFQP